MRLGNRALQARIIAIQCGACQLIGVNSWQSPAASGESRILKKLAPQFKVVFDVGANTGEYSREALRRNPEATIFAFDLVAKPIVCKEIFAYQNILAVEAQHVADIVKVLA